MEYLLELEAKEKEDLVKKRRILLGTNLYSANNGIATMTYNPKSHVTLVIGPRGVGKTNVSKLIISQDIRNFAQINNRKYLILDYKGIDWRTIRFPQKNIAAVHPYMEPFAIKNIKTYTPAYDEYKAFKDDYVYGFAPIDFKLKDWMQAGQSMDIGAWQLKNLALLYPEVFNSPVKLIKFIMEAASSSREAVIRKNNFYLDPRTKNVLVRQIGIFIEDKVLVSIDSSYRRNYQVFEDLKANIIPVMQFAKDETNPYVQFYSGKMLRDLYVERNLEWNSRKPQIGNVTLVVEEANVIFNNRMNTNENPAAAAIAGMIQQGRTLGFSLYLISQSLSSLHPVALENWNNLIIGANTGPNDKELLRNMNVSPHLIDDIMRLKFQPHKNRYEFMFIGNDRTKGIKFNAALSPVGTTEEAV